jgi:hypothetical protein
MKLLHASLPLWVAAVICLVLFAFGLARAASPAPGHAAEGTASRVIYPVTPRALAFDHARHARLGARCVDCHAGATKSRSTLDRLAPPPTTCDRCHFTDHRDLRAVRRAEDQPLAACSVCHVGYRPEDGNRVARAVHAPANLRFDHAVHAQRNVGCAQCHGPVERMAEAGRAALPTMRGCFNCHGLKGPAQGRASGECLTCHLAEDGRMRTEFASGTLLPPAWFGRARHDLAFLKNHAKDVALGGELCRTCHEERECADCHDGRVRDRRIHPNDWLSQHGMATRMGPGDCTSCHRQQSFCLSCHQRTGVSQSAPTAALARRGRFHPAKSVWTNGPRTRSHHAWQAQRNMDACVSCHVERDCTSCHATAARGGAGSKASPHPSGFLARCRSVMRKNARPCLVCHDSQDSSLDRCR